MLVEQVNENYANETNRKGLETFFIEDGSQFDEMELGVYYFYNVTLARDIGNLKKGDKFLGMMLDINKTLIQFDVDHDNAKFLIFKFGF